MTNPNDLGDAQSQLFTLGRLIGRIFDADERGGVHSDTQMTWMGNEWSGYIDIYLVITAEESKVLAGLDIEPFKSGVNDDV